MKNGIGYRQLRAFQAVYETRSMTAAARMLGITQPAVSSLLARLEQDIGLTLFRRGGGSLIPSREAQALYSSANQAVAGVRNVESTVLALKKGTGGYLSIAAQPLVSLSILPPVIAALRAEHPEVVFGIHTTTSVGVGTALFSDMHDIGIAALPLDTASVRLQTFRAPCVAVLPPGHRLAEQEAITPRLLDGLPFASMMPERYVYHLVERAFDAEQAHLNVACEAEYFAVAAGVVAHGDCVSVVDPFTACQFAGDVIVRPFLPRIDYEFAIYRHPDRELTPAARAFVSTFCAAVEARLAAG